MRCQKRDTPCSIGDWPTMELSLSARGGPQAVRTSKTISRMFMAHSIELVVT